MNRLKIICLSVLVLGLVGSLILAVIAARGPTWEGRTIQTWVEDFRLGGGEGHRRAVKAIRAIGTNAIPDLVQLLRAEDSDFKQAMRALPERFLARSIRTLPSVHHWRAQTGLEALGATAVPVLIDLLSNTNTDLAERALEVLISIGEDGVPTLQQALTSKNRELQIQVAHTLGLLREEASTAVPALLLVLNGEDEQLRIEAGHALHQIDPDIAIQAGVEPPQSSQPFGFRPSPVRVISTSQPPVTSSRSSRE